jgi:hypothetical protein
MKIIIPLEDRYTTKGFFSKKDGETFDFNHFYFKYIKLFNIIFVLGKVDKLYIKNVFNTHKCKVILNKSSIDKNIKLYSVVCMKCESVLKVTSYKREAYKYKKIENKSKCMCEDEKENKEKTKS